MLSLSLVWCLGPGMDGMPATDWVGVSGTGPGAETTSCLGHHPLPRWAGTTRRGRTGEDGAFEAASGPTGNEEPHAVDSGVIGGEPGRK